MRKDNSTTEKGILMNIVNVASYIFLKKIYLKYATKTYNTYLNNVIDIACTGSDVYSAYG